MDLEDGLGITGTEVKLKSTDTICYTKLSGRVFWFMPQK